MAALHSGSYISLRERKNDSIVPVSLGRGPCDLTLISSCAVQRVNDSASRAENEASTARQYNGYLQNQQPEPARDTVIFSEKPWVSTQPLVTKRGLL